MNVSTWWPSDYEIMLSVGPRVVFGLRNGPLAIRRVHRNGRYLWKVDHLPSGLSLSEAIGLYESEASARLVVELLLRLYQGWERQNWCAKIGDNRELHKALGLQVRVALEQAGLRGIPDHFPGVRLGKVVWLNGYASTKSQSA